jgi:hypothetical protein
VRAPSSDRTNARTMTGRVGVCCALFLGASLAFGPHSIAFADDEPRAEAIRKPEIDAATETLKADPNLQTTRQTRSLRWVSDDDEEKKGRSSWLKWIGDFFRWVAEAGRLLVWVVIAILVGLLALYLVRMGRTLNDTQRMSASAPPTHVRDLDIRPESLPDDIGAAAWSLWEGGDHRGALSLLYRGLLSRLAHAHAVPIRDSSTEGDCLALAERHLPTDRHGYVLHLIRTWQRAVYGGEDPQTHDIRALCDQFERALHADAPTHEVSA